MSIFDDFDNWYIPAPRKRSDGDGKVVSSEKIKQPISRQIFDAASRGNIAKVTTLLENNQHEDVHILVNGLNVFHVVSKKGYVELIDLLLAYDPSLFRSRSTDQRDAFMLASFEGRLNVLQVLRSYERETFDDITNDEAVDDNGNSSLHYAAWGGHVECVRFLVEECGKDINIVNNDQISPLQYAAAGNHTPVVEYLSIISHSKSDESISGISPLHRAAAYGSYECLVAFIEQYHCEVESRTQNNSTALHFAAQHGHKEIVEYLCEHAKAMVDPENSYGVTPLQFACMGGYVSIVSMLVKRGADPLKFNLSGENAFHIAAANGNHEICKLLNHVVAEDPFKKNREGKTIVEKALEAGFKELANSMVQWSCIHFKSEEFKQLLKDIDC